MLCCECAPASSSRPAASADLRIHASVRPCPSRRAVLQTSLHFAAAVTSGTWTAWLAPCAGAKVLETRKGAAGERDVIVLSSGVMVADVREGHGSSIHTGDLVVAHIVGFLEDGTVFLNTRADEEQALTFELGIQTDVVTDGLEAAIVDMRFGGQRLAVVPPELGYGTRGHNTPLASVPRNATLYYEIELLRCEELDSAVKVCCDEEHFPCTAPDGDDDGFGEMESQPLSA